MSIFLLETCMQEVAGNPLLGNSQTFIGVLATLVVLYLYSSESNGNFFVSFVKHLGDEAREVVSHHITALSDNVDNQFLNTDEEKNEGLFWQKTLDPIIKSGDSGANEAKALKQKLLLIVVAAQKIPVSFSNKTTPLVNDVDKRMGELAKAIEFEFVAFYTFFFSLLMLCIDCIFKTIGDFCLYFLYSFTVSSFVFLLIIWVHLWRKTTKIYDPKNKYHYKKKTFKDHSLFWMKIVGVFVLLPFLTIIWGSYLGNFFVNLSCIFLVYILCFSLGGGLHFSQIKNSHKYNRHFVLSHFIYLFIAALGIAFLCTSFSVEEMTSNIWNFDSSKYIVIEHCKNVEFLKGMIVLFIVLNGVVMPFVLSYARSKVIRWGIGRTIEKRNKEALGEIRTYKKSYNETITQIKDFIRNQ